MIAILAIAGWISQTQVKDTKKGMMTTCIHIAIVNCIGVLLFSVNIAHEVTTQSF